MIFLGSYVAKQKGYYAKQLRTARVCLEGKISKTPQTTASQQIHDYPHDFPLETVTTGGMGIGAAIPTLGISGTVAPRPIAGRAAIAPVPQVLDPVDLTPAQKVYCHVSVEPHEGANGPENRETRRPAPVVLQVNPAHVQVADQIDHREIRLVVRIWGFFLVFRRHCFVFCSASELSPHYILF